MFFSQQLLQMGFFGTVFLLLLLSADYYLLTFYEGDIAPWFAKLLFLFERLVVPIRVAFVVLYFVILSVANKIPRYQGPQHQNKSFEIHSVVQGMALIIFLLSVYLLINFENTFISFRIGYPVVLFSIIVFLPFCRFLFPEKKDKLGSLVKRKKLATKDSINLRTKGRGWVNVPEPFRHTIVIAGSGSGKTESVVRPYMSQFVKKGYCGILYDYKFPTLTNELNTILIQHQKKLNYQKKAPLPLYVLDFEDMTRCHRVNPIRPDYIKDISYAEEIATSIYNNLDLSSVKQSGNFFTRSAINWFTALIWFYKVKHPEQCTLPHVFNTILYQDFQHVFSMLLSEPTCGDYIRSIVHFIGHQGRPAVRWPGSFFTKRHCQT